MQPAPPPLIGPSAAPPERPGSGPTAAGLRVGRLFGVPLHVQGSGLIAAAVFGIMFAPIVRFWYPGSGVLAYLLALLLPGAIGLSVLAHELGHLFAGRLCGVAAKRISLDVLGGVTEFEDDPSTPGRDAFIAASGPAVSALLAAAGYTAVATAPVEGFTRLLLTQFAQVNLLLTLFNILPGLPLDGGWVLRAGLWKLTGRPILALRIAAGAGLILATILTAYLVWQLSTEDRPALLYIVVLGTLAYQIWTGAIITLREARAQQNTQASRAGAETSPAPDQQPS